MGSYLVIIDNERKIDRMINSVDKSEVMINRLGCEVIGYRVSDPVTRKTVPLLYRDSQPEPPESGWKNHATILFPIVGGLKNKKSLLGDKVISFRGNHGFARHSEFDLIATGHEGRSILHYRLKPNQEIRGYYPFDFQLDLIYVLQGNVLTVTFDITNPGSEAIYYQSGWHPGFATPFVKGQGSKADCRLILPAGEITKYHNNEHCRLTGETSKVKTGKPLAWTEQELEATLMFEIDNPAQRSVTLEDPASKISVRVDFPEFPHLGFWSEPGFDFICIEPWQGMDDREEQEPFDKKVGIVRLEPGARDLRSIKITPSLG
jgi:galactose mutarotase-like enzyme